MGKNLLAFRSVPYDPSGGLAGPSSSRNANLLHGMVLRAKPRPVGFNSAVQRSLSTLDITKSPLCPSATTRSPSLGMRFFRLAMPHIFPRPRPDDHPLWISVFTAARKFGTCQRLRP